MDPTPTCCASRRGGRGRSVLLDAPRKSGHAGFFNPAGCGSVRPISSVHAGARIIGTVPSAHSNLRLCTYAERQERRLSSA